MEPVVAIYLEHQEALLAACRNMVMRKFHPWLLLLVALLYRYYFMNFGYFWLIRLEKPHSLPILVFVSLQ